MTKQKILCNVNDTANPDRKGTHLKISVITPCFNGARYLEETLHSIHDQKGDFELEHIVMDGGSTDGSLDILEKWSDRLSFVSEPDKGQSDAINKGFKQSTGKVITWLNTDDVYLPGALSEVVKVFNENTGARWVTGRCRIVNEQTEEIRKIISAYRNIHLAKFSYMRLLLDNYISQPSTFYTKELLDEAGGVDENLTYAMDYDLWLRFALIEPPVILKKELAAFRFHKEAKTGGSYEKSLQEANRVVRLYANKINKPWMGSINYWFYYKRTNIIYRLLE